MNLTPDITNLLHEHYHTMRKMLKSGFPRRGVQKSFEELVYSVIGKDSWRPTHITRSALSECVTGSTRNIQRAHGILSDRMDRMDRTMIVLAGETKTFDEWWSFFTHHDKTILVTRREHNSGQNFKKSDLIELPSWEEDMFYNSGFSVKIRKKTEGVWLSEQHDKFGV